MNVKVQKLWFDKRSTELTPKSHHDFISPLYQKIILSLSKDSFGFNSIFDAVVQSRDFGVGRTLAFDIY